MINRKIPTVTVRRIYNVIAGKLCKKALRALSNGPREQEDRVHTVFRQSENFKVPSTACEDFSLTPHTA